MKKILVPTDFSRESEEAFKVAIDMALQTNGEILLLHVLAISNLYTPGYAGEPLAFDPEYYTRLENDVKEALKKMQKRGTDKSVKVKFETVYGDLTLSVKNTIKSHKIDLVVMGTSGASGFTEFFIGSNTEKVVRFSPVPVLAVRKAIELKSVKNILFPSTLDLNQTDFMKKLKDLQKFFDATLHVLLVNTPVHFMRDTEGNEALDEFAKHYQLTNFKLHFRNYAREEDGIIDFAHSEEADLIAMGTHARKGLAHLFNGSVAEKVVNHIQIPIWTYCIKG